MESVPDLPRDEDASLVASCLKGDPAAFEVLVGRYQSLVCALIYNRCGNIGQSEDLAQETFLAAWKSLASLRDATRFKEWLSQIARNVSANAARGESRKPQGHSFPIALMPDVSDGRSTPETETMSREEEALVWGALEQLPDTYRLPLILFHREGESVTEVAGSLDLSEDAVRQRLARGREMLRQEVSSLIEGVLSKTRPGKRFTIGVLAAISASAGSSAEAGTIGVTGAQAVVAAKTATAFFPLGLAFLPLIGDFLIWLVFRAKARTPRERVVLQRQVLFMVATDALLGVWVLAVFHFMARPWIWVAASDIGFGVLRWLQLFRAFRKAGWLGEKVMSPDGHSSRRGYAPGWQVRCPKCGLSVDAGAAGLIRIGAVGDTRRLGPCSRCKRFRWLIIERTN